MLALSTVVLTLWACFSLDKFSASSAAMTSVSLHCPINLLMLGKSKNSSSHGQQG